LDTHEFIVQIEKVIEEARQPVARRAELMRRIVRR
jgi:hypothetical protein